MWSRLNPALVLGVMLAGCSGETPSEPEALVPVRPDIAGTYFIEARFDELTNPALGSNGFVGLGQPSQENAALGGAIRLGATLGEDFFPSWDAEGMATFTTAAQDVNFSASKVISFTVSAEGTRWTFSGTVTGQTAAGRHTLTDGITALTGDWSMSLAELDDRGLKPSTTAGICMGVMTDGAWYASYNGQKSECFSFCPFCNFTYGTADLGPLD